MHRHLPVCALALALAFSAVYATPPRTLSMQGVMRDSGGNVVPDGPYSVVFSIYTQDTAGSPVWQSARTIETQDGIYDVVLGEATPIDLDFDVQYWLGLAIEGEPELLPRVKLTASPYAFRAAVADSLAGGVPSLELPWSDTVPHVDPAFSVGNTSVGAALHGESVGGPGIEAQTGDATAVTATRTEDGKTATLCDQSYGARALNPSAGSEGYMAGPGHGVYGSTSNTSGAGVFGTHTGASGIGVSGTSLHGAGVYAWSSDGPGLTASSPNGDAIHATATSGHYAGDFVGVIRVQGFELPLGGGVGKVLTSDLYGVASWADPVGAPDSDWTITGDDMYCGNAGYVGIGTDTPERRLHIRDTVAGGVSYPLKLDNPENDAGSAVGILFKIDSGTESRGKGGLVYERTGTWNRGSFHFLQDNNVSYSNPDLADAVMTIDNDGNVGIGTTTPTELLQVAGTIHSTTGGFKFPDGTVQTTTAEGGITLPYSDSASTGGYVFSVSNTGAGDGLYANAPSGTGVEASSGTGSGVWATSSSGDALHAITYNGRGLYAEDAGGKTVTVCDTTYGVAADNPLSGTKGHMAGPNHGIYGETSVSSGNGVYGKHNGSGSAVFGNAPSGTGVEASSGTGSGLWATSSSGDAVHAISATGRAGYFEGGVQTDGFKLTSGATSGYVLTSDASGAGTWQPPVAGSDGDWVISGSNIYSVVNEARAQTG